MQNKEMWLRNGHVMILLLKTLHLWLKKKDPKGSYETKELPCAYIKNLQGHITNVLDRLDRYKQIFFKKYFNILQLTKLLKNTTIS